MAFSQYIHTIHQRYQSGITTEHSFRGDLEEALHAILPNVRIINEPKRIEAGAPDYILMHPREEIPLGYIEAKDIGKNLASNEYKEQFGRYKQGLANLIITDYLSFEFYYQGEKYDSVTIGVLMEGEIRPLPQNFEKFRLLLQSFINKQSETITSAEHLAKMMANKAKLLANVIYEAVEQDKKQNRRSELRGMLESFREYLIHDLNSSSFADIYAQTIAYGMFAARYNDDNLDTFSRHEAATLIPHSNPFLRRLFGSIAGIDLDERIAWIVDDLVNIFRYTDVKRLMANYGRATGMNDPVIHFYETFLAEYDPELREARGVWYTPKPVVNFIVRAVDSLLKEKFGIEAGLADTQKITLKQKAEGTATARGKDIYEERAYHRVQILDPATGTGTFLNEVVTHIYQNFKGMEGIWSQYVEEDLIPRLNGFELLMASYAMAHLKMGMLLDETGYTPTEENQYRLEHERRFRIFLTNSLEEHHKDTGTLFAQWLSSESEEANRIKRDTPVMVVLGNPPYSGESANTGEWIMNLMEDYKKEPGGKERLKERNPKWINDDYVKFMRYGQHYIEKNGEGILAYINPHGFLDNPTFRGMRWELLRAYDEIYVLDLHGNARKKEVSPDGSADVNVFDIMTGVSINLLVKTGKKKKGELAQVYHADLYGARRAKYDFLTANNLQKITWTKLENVAPQYLFVPRNYEILKAYDSGFKVNDLLSVNSVGIVTARDNFTVQTTKALVEETVTTFLSLEDEDARAHFNLGKDVRDWKVSYARKDLIESGPDFNNIVPINYRPFDQRYTYYTGNSKGFHCYPRNEVMRHLVNQDNLGLAICRQVRSGDKYQHVFMANMVIESSYVSNKTSEITNVMPLYLYPEGDVQNERIPNLDKTLLAEIEQKLGLPFVAEEADKSSEKAAFAPIDLLDYIYAVLHSPTYRETYKEFLKTDFPRVPYPTDQAQFWQLVKLGKELRAWHLMEHPDLQKISLAKYPNAGSNEITNRLTKSEKSIREMEENPDLLEVWINKEQCFSHIPKSAWEFYIGGYQPADKWLKDRRGETLTHSDVRHYLNIITVLDQTEKLMQKIDELDILGAEGEAQ